MATDFDLRRRGQAPKPWGQAPKLRGQAPGFRRGQALIELGMGMFLLALVLAALFALADYTVRSLEMQRDIRAEAGERALDSCSPGGYASSVHRDTLEVEPLAAEYVFGTESVRLREECHMPCMRLR